MSSNPEVLVVGAGPVGLTAAHELSRRGVRVRLVDRADGPATTSRATANHARTLEVYDQMGILGDILARGRRAEHFTMHRAGRQLIRFDTDYSHLPTRYPFTLQVDQTITEEVLRTRLAAMGVKVEWGVELTRLQQDDSAVTATLGTAAVTVPWLIGADGAHSLVRKELGFELRGESTETWLVADAVIDAELPPDSLHWIHVGGGTVLLVPFPAPGKWRLLDTVDVTAVDDPETVAERFSAKLSRGLGRRVRVAAPSWISVFTIQQRMVQQMRHGRCFVAGDAAHIHSPASGQGMNTGIQDAVNLTWKLADVIRGHADSGLMDSYAAERVPVGAQLLKSTKIATALVALQNATAPVALPLGLGFLSAVKPLKRKVERKMMAEMSGLLLDYGASPLSLGDAEGSGGFEPGRRVGCSAKTEAASAGWRALTTELADPRWTLLVFDHDDEAALTRLEDLFGAAVSIRTVDGRDRRGLADPGGDLRRDFGTRPGACSLIRPDGYLAWRGQFPGVEQMAAVLQRVHLVPKQRTAAHRDTGSISVK